MQKAMPGIALQEIRVENPTPPRMVLAKKPALNNHPFCNPLLEQV